MVGSSLWYGYSECTVSVVLINWLFLVFRSPAFPPFPYRFPREVCPMQYCAVRRRVINRVGGAGGGH